MISARTQSLLDRVPVHAIAATVKTSIVDALGAAESFAAKKAELETSGTLTARGQRQALRDALVHQYGKDLARAREPIAKVRKDIAARRDAMKVKAVDKTDIAGALERQEIRAYLRTLDANARQTLAMTTTNVQLLEALVTAPPELSGFDGNLAHIADQIEQRYFELAYADEISAITSMEAVIAEGDAAVSIARGMFQGTMGMEEREFENFMVPIERRANAPWLLKQDGSSSVLVVEMENGLANYRPATDSDLSNGVFYENLAAYQDARQAA